MHDIVHTAAEGHPRGFLAEHVFLEAAQHVFGGVSAPAGRDNGNIDALRREPAGDQAHITARALCAEVRD
jgi:hypothetical protein